MSSLWNRCLSRGFIYREKTARLRARWYQLGFGDSQDVIKNSMYIDSLTDTDPCMRACTEYFGWLGLVTSQTDARTDDAMNQLSLQFRTVDRARSFVCFYSFMNRNTDDLDNEKQWHKTTPDWNDQIDANLYRAVFVTLPRVNDSPASTVGERNKFIYWWVLAHFICIRRWTADSMNKSAPSRMCPNWPHQSCFRYWCADALLIEFTLLSPNIDHNRLSRKEC